MTSPLIRTWLAARLEDWADHGYAIWRGLLHSLLLAVDDAADAVNRLAARRGWRLRLGITIREWDPCFEEFKLPAPGLPVPVAAGPPGTAAPALTRPPSPASNPRWRPWKHEYLLRICDRDLGGCGAHISAECTTADGKRTRPHKVRRQP